MQRCLVLQFDTFHAGQIAWLQRSQSARLGRTAKSSSAFTFPLGYSCDPACLVDSMKTHVLILSLEGGKFYRPANP